MPVTAIVAVAAVASVAVGVIGAQKQAKAQQNAAEQEAKAQRIAEKREKARLRREQRQRTREERVRRAAILQRSENKGVGESSGVSGATSALATNFGSANAFAQGEFNKYQAIGAAQQRAADFRQDANEIGANTVLAQSIFKGAATVAGSFQDAASSFAGASTG